MQKIKEKTKQTVLRVKEDTELLAFLAIHFNGKSRNALKNMLTHKQVCVNGKPVSQYNYPLHIGDSIVINTGKVHLEFKHSRIKLVYEDDYLIVIEKAEGLLAVATDERKEETTAFSILSNYLKHKDPHNRLFVVHRIDRETSGLLMYAKSREVQLALQENWHENVTERVYYAVVEGKPEKTEDTIISYLRQSKALKTHSSDADDGGKEAITHYRVVRSNEDYAMLRVELDTGRKNQIRVHLQTIGCPIVGDKKYGASSSPIGRVGLHARTLAFKHPVTDENLRFETPIPTKFNALFVKNKEK
ncbi:MAG: RluA family pseudouridine synthase [Prevotellaceae bacterium]|jgi:23S rRNA pseudouridine1911/1915/1917 synthase|nr:RluA family pseudouridine synthase [Prevotellaceae bacterium]